MIELATLLQALPDLKLVHGPGDLSIGGIEEDSRRIFPGDLFVAVRGTRMDGAQFIPEALRRGAVAVAAEPDTLLHLPDRIAQLTIRNGRLAAARLASASLDHPERAVMPIGVTGTNGKTTTAQLIRHIMNHAGFPTGFLGTTGYLFGDELRSPVETTPGGVRLINYLAAMREAGERFVAMEVSSHALDQGRTASLEFGAGVLTNITPDHLDYHGGMTAYKRAKSRLFESLATSAWAVLNQDDPSSSLIAQLTPAHVIRYGLTSGDVRGQVLYASSRRTVFNLIFPDGGSTVRLPMLGTYNVSNALAAAATTWALGIPGPEVAAALEQAPAVPGRLEPVHAGQRFPVLVDYAHTEDALRCVLRTLRPLVSGKLILVFGCGGDRDPSKRARMGQVARYWADTTILTSDNPRSEDPQRILNDIEQAFEAGDDYERHVDRSQAIQAAIARARDGLDLVLIAGKGHEAYQEFEGGRRIAFDDRSIARAALKQRINSTGGCSNVTKTSDPPPSPVSKRSVTSSGRVFFPRGSH